MLDNKLPQNVQNITWSHQLYGENHENLESRVDSLAETKIQEVFFKEMHYHPYYS